MTLLSREEIAAGLPADWRHEGDALVLDRTLADFDAAMAFAVAVADIARQADHHPDILVHRYNRVRLTVSTHSEGGITERDLALARAVDALG